MTHLIGERRRGAPAGPPPPTSWLIDSIHAPEHLRAAKKIGNDSPGSRRLDRLPRLFLPEKNSLLHQTLKSLAKNWQWHVEYNKYYLATLPVRCKETLLSYIVTYGSTGRTVDLLKTLFLDETELADATGSDTVTHLDLGGAITDSVTFKDLSDYFTKKPSRQNLVTSPTTVLDSWDSFPTASPTILPSLDRFPLLTHLSLAHPASPSWRAVLALTSRLHLLTHLSLAYWPTPSLTPNSRTATTVSPQGKVLPYGGSTIYSHTLDGDWSEAVSILRRLGKGTLCLKWLDLEGCSSWLEALTWTECPAPETFHRTEHLSPESPEFSESQDIFPTNYGIPWLSHWRSLTTIRTAQPSLPPSLLTASGGWVELLKPSSTLVPLSVRKIDEYAYRAREDHARKVERRELLEWLREERKIESVIRTVKTITRKRGGKEFEVAFERGWPGGWVERAMKEGEKAEERWWLTR